MNVLIQNWVDNRKKDKRKKEDNQIDKENYQAAAVLSLPENIRAVTSADIVKDAVIWFPDYGVAAEDGLDGVAYWKVIKEVLDPKHQFKAYVTYNNNRYGLDEGGFVEI